MAVLTQGAAEAALCVARRYGVEARQAQVLRRGENTIVRLAPWPVVAKVSNISVRPRGASGLARELRIARHLVSRGAPIAGPSPELPLRVHLEDRYAMTFWHFHRPKPEAALEPVHAARALADLHLALATYPDSFPSFLDRHAKPAEDVLNGLWLTPDPPRDDLSVLEGTLARVKEQLASRSFAQTPLHGEPDRSRLLLTAGSYLWVDFEACCLGPKEWDLTVLPGGGEGVFMDTDRPLLDVLQDLRSVCIVARCWMQPERRQSLRERVG
jgi:hypothetical protein